MSHLVLPSFFLFLLPAGLALGALQGGDSLLPALFTDVSPGSFLDHLLKDLISVFVILDAPGMIPIFLSLTEGMGRPARRRTAAKASMVCLAVLMAFALGGPALLGLFGITVPAFRIAGGILLFSIALGMLRVEMLRTKATPEEVVESHGKEDVSVFPLGIPMLAGPGTIATVTVLARGPVLGKERLALLGAVVTAVFLNLLVLRAGGAMERVLGRTGMNILNRIMGLILAVMAVQFVLDGMKEVLPVLAAACRAG